MLTAYHLMTIVFEKVAAAKLLWTNTDRTWIKNLGQVMVQQVPPRPGPYARTAAGILTARRRPPTRRRSCRL